MKSQIKNIFLCLSVLAVGSTVLAQVEGFDILPKDHIVEYLSWCDNNQVVSMTTSGQFFVVSNCESQGQICKTIQRQTTSGTYYYGACMDKK